MVTRSKAPETLTDKKFWLSKNAKSITGLEDKIKGYKGQIIRRIVQGKIYIVCLPEERVELWGAPDKKKNSPLWKAYQAGKTFIDTTAFDHLTHDIESWKPTEFIPPAPRQKIPQKSAVLLERESSLVLDTISVSSTCVPNDEASRPERFAAPNISKLTQTTKVALEEQPFLDTTHKSQMERSTGLSETAAEMAEMAEMAANMAAKMAGMAAKMADMAPKMAAENISCVQAAKAIEEVFSRIEVQPESDNENS
ncbi:hypothetical protein FCOIX_335 [Fusarium coicis]|nr:hypothetical protein FCOIX_335 [Fusarium coicis]